MKFNLGRLVRNNIETLRTVKPDNASMDSTWITLTVIAVTCLAIYLAAPRNQASNRRISGSATSAMGIMDEIFQPAVHEAAVFLQIQNEIGIANPSPEGKPFEGQISITI